MGTTWRPSGTFWGPLGTPWRSLGDHLPVLLDALGASWGFFGGNLDLQGALMGSQRGSRRPVGGLVLAFWKLRKCLRSNWLQYAKTLKFTVRYCKNRGLGRLKPLKICLNFHNTREKKHKNHKLNNIVSKIDTRAAKMAPRSSKMSSGGGVRVTSAWRVLEECLRSAWRVLGECLASA